MKRGFTLIELLVVITVLGVLTAMIVPRFGGTFDDIRLSSSARELLSLFKLAHSQAVTTHKTHRLRVDARENHYQLEVERVSEKGRRFEPVRELPGAYGRLEDGITIELERSDDGDSERRPPARRDRESSIEAIEFRPDGTASPRRLVLRDRHGFGIAVKVHPVTARASLEKLERELGR